RAVERALTRSAARRGGAMPCRARFVRRPAAVAAARLAALAPRPSRAPRPYRGRPGGWPRPRSLTALQPLGGDGGRGVSLLGRFVRRALAQRRARETARPRRVADAG